MKRPGKPAGREKRGGSQIALALTWDGARWPTRLLPPKARAFLSGPSRDVPSIRKMAELFAGDQVSEMRVCWVPCLKGGSGVLSEPFKTLAGTRIGFQSVKSVRLGDMLGVIYRKNN
jgi:hypothetical protein